MGFNSLHALRKIDPLLEQEVVRVSVHGTDFAMREKNLQWIAKPGNFHWQENWCTERDELRYGPTRFLPISRYNLHASLLQGLQFNPSSPNCEGGKLLSGREISNWKETPTGVEVTLSDGTEIEGDVLVGAEGGQSPIRSELHKRFGSTTLGPAPPNPYTGMSLWGGTTNQMGPLLRSNKEENLFMWNFLDDGSLFLVLPMKPGGDLAYWSLGLNRDTPGDPSFAKSTYDLRNWLLKEGSRFSDDLHVADYINSTDFSLSPSSEGGFYRWDLFDLGDRTVPHWGSGRVTLIGDAAHQVTPWVGQGAGISIEDAHCFGVYAAQLLYHNKFDGNLDGMLRSYETHRNKRATFIRDEARRNKTIWLANSPMTRFARKFLMGYLVQIPFIHKAQVRKLLDYDDPPDNLCDLFVPPPPN
eukprot:CAMPEP_0201501398 /NCGR_PEP_ID=MMETSP0151_2-20130828/83569_1 /ASSEMBLY_ACC=CAM_ASM_000257 /TAXON_ID=200890 /ORGANISM="Paramoeba atlantica, Strain 621/1 / CCAP 1560/9" /LENGTH=413 /DNA_ID=CAMNT_0047894905 /DNA_START=2246 /DNA_END=3487 /DNA_ORIENTATION=-